MEIKNKLESIKKINELKLNKFPEQLFNKGKIEKMLACLKEIKLMGNLNNNPMILYKKKKNNL